MRISSATSLTLAMAALVAGTVCAPQPEAAQVERRAGAPSAARGCAGRTLLSAPPAGQAYHTAYFSPTNDEQTVTDASIDDFETKTQRAVGGVVFSDAWGHGGRVSIGFPATKVRTIWQHGALPMVRMMPWSSLSNPPDPTITMQRVVRGRYDAALRRWFRDARDQGIPLWVEFGVEANGRWFPWNGVWNGGGRRGGYGDDAYPDGPERFRDAYRHLVRLSRQVGADDLTWVFHADIESWPAVGWNQARWYYPGDRFVDWIAVSVYGELVPSGKPSHWTAAADRLGDPTDRRSNYRRIAALAPSKPRALVEFGVTEDPEAGEKGQWYADVYEAVHPVTGDYDFDLISVWSERWKNGNGTRSDLRVNSSPGALGAYRAAIADPAVVSSPSFSCS
jgi:hypothetical protein